MMQIMNTPTIPSLNPGECSESYAEGWRKAESAIRQGQPTNGDCPTPLADVDEFAGYADRMNIHNYLEEMSC